MCDIAENEKATFLRILNEQKEADLNDSRTRERKQNARLENVGIVQDQISNNTLMKKQLRQDFLEEGRMLRQD